MGIENHAVIERRGTRSCHTGDKTLSSAAITGDQMIHDLAGEDNAVRLQHLSVDLDCVAESSRPDGNQVGFIVANVIEIANPVE